MIFFKFRQRVKEAIAADRLAQKLAREAEAAKAAGQAPPAQPAPKPTMAQNVQKQNYDECRIQIRLTDGKTMVEKFKANEQLFAVSLGRIIQCDIGLVILHY